MQTTNNISPSWARPFYTLWSGQAISLLGSRIAQFALIWWLTEKTGSAVILTTLSLMVSLPQVVLGPFAGALVDRLNRRNVMLVADSLAALASTLLALLFWTNHLQTWHIFVATFIVQLGGTMQLSAMTASTTLMVPKENFSRVQGANQTLQGILLILAPLIGALIIDILTLPFILGIDVVTAAFAIIPLFFITIPTTTQTGGLRTVTPSSLWHDIQAGFAYMRSFRALLLLSSLVIVVNLFQGPIPSLIPILVKEHFVAGAFQFAWMRMAIGAGFICGGLVLSTWGNLRTRRSTIPFGLALMALATFMIGLSPEWAIGVAVAGMLLAGMAMAIINGTIFATMQASVAPEMQGRVFTAYQSTSMAAMPLGLVLAGFWTENWNATSWVVVAGIVTLCAAISILFSPSILGMGKELTATQGIPQTS